MQRFILLVVSLIVLVACGSPSASQPEVNVISSAATTQGQRTKLRLATTTSTADTGLLDAILPDFEQQFNVDVEVVAVGTGQALKLGENGDADIVLVHARSREDEFVAAGFGINRRDVMYNDFVIVGPPSDPAHIRGVMSAQDAFAKIAAAGAIFASRGDESGTHTKEQSIWATTGITPTAELTWYKSLGQGMGETLVTANEQGAYTLSDRGTWLATQARLPQLTLLVGGATVKDNPDKSLLNPYGVIQVNPARHAGVNAALAEHFITWITSPTTQERIGSFGHDRYGQALFNPQAEP